MKRKIGIGDILIAAGLLLIVVFILVDVIATKKLPTWNIINGIVLVVLALGAGGILALSMLGSPKLMNILYAFSGFMLLLHLNIVNVTSYYGGAGPFGFAGASGRVFYVFVGALLVGVGTYFSQHGSDILGGGKEE